MGAKESKPSCINYENAIKRVSDSELHRIKESFKRSSGSTGAFLSQSAFLQDVLCEGVPPIIADWLFTACGGTQKGISFKDLLCGLVLLTRGTEEEKIKFLWNLYCNDSGTYILKSDYLKALSLESSLHQVDNPDIQGLNHASVTLSLFHQADRVNFDQFKDWIIYHKKSSVLSKWILSEACVNLTSELETPTFYQSLAGVTHLEEHDIGDLEKVFWILKGSAKNGQLDLESLGPLISPPIPKAALYGVFCAFDENRDEHIDFKELCCGVSAACRGPSVERSKFCFKVFDIDRDGILNYDEIKQMIDILILVAKESSSANNFKTINGNNVVNDLLTYSRKNSNSRQSNIPSSEETTPTSENSTIGEFTLTQEDFMMWSVESPLNLVQPFLDLLFEVCHIVLGLRPQCKHLEHDIVKGWLAREERRGCIVGQFWYLIAAEWWQHWAQYTQNVSITPCSSCKTSQNFNGNKHILGIDEAMVCDESFTSNSTESMGDLLATADSASLGSGSSGISYGRNLNSPPGPIDNTSLIAHNVYQTIPTLTGEGGRLKGDLLTQHRDFELVPDSLWKALSQWYKGPLPLPRQVIQPPNSPDVELELYPLNLRILRHQNTTPVTQTVSTWGAVSGGYGALTSGGNYTTIASVPQTLQPPKKYLAYTAAFSRLATIKQVGEFLCKNIKLKQEDIRLWHILSSGALPCSDAYLLEEEYKSLHDLIINDNDQILLEIRNKDLTWPEELGSLSLTQNSSHQERRPTSASIYSVHAPGATGLHNLGNTCFMNAALQVLFNTQPLTQYFKKNMHLYEINTTNKLGTKGQLAIKYGELLKEVWTATTRSIAPLKLRFCVTKHAPQFAGGGQHDSQELLEWLLDALHEDLNRVMEKPYSELKDSNGRADAVVAEEAWLQHHARNQSIVIDLFYGQLKSKVSCQCCKRESVRFDPFSLLSLPLPVENFIYCEVLVILLDGSVPIKYGLRLISDSKYIDLKKELANLCYLDPNLMLICELSNSQARSVNDEQKIKQKTATELYVYQLPEGGDDNRSRTSSIILGVNIEKGLKDIQRTPALLIASDKLNQSTTMLTQPTSTMLHQTSCPSQQQHQLHQQQQQHNSIQDDGHQQINDINYESTFTPTPAENVSSKHLADISASPESTFVNNYRKRISTTNLLVDNTQSYNNSSEEINLDKINLDTFEDELINRNSVSNVATTDCPCRSVSTLDSGEEDNTPTSHFQSNVRKDSYFPKTSTNSIVGTYLIAVHRKLSRQDTYFLSYHKTRPSLFGVPLLIPCYENGTNKDLYCAVWVQVARLLSPLPPTPPDQANHATDCDDSLGYEFPFTLRAVTDDGRVCALCPWSNFCRGCEIPCNDDLLLQKSFMAANSVSSNTSTPRLSTRVSSSPNLDRSRPSTPTLNSGYNINNSAIHIAIDWDPTALHLRYQSTRERLWTDHESVAICRRQQIEPVDLNHCLRAFTSEEKLEQWYHCSHCKGKKPATKKLQIWKLPPILIVHLKRFNCVNGKWVKSQKVVNFPFEDFDPTPYLASVPQETILRHKDLLELKENNNINMCNEDCKQELAEFDQEYFRDHNNKMKTTTTTTSENEPTIHENEDEYFNNTLTIDDTKDNFNNANGQIDNSNQQIIMNEAQSAATIENRRKSVTRKLPSSTLEKRKRLISTSLSKTPVIDGKFTDFHTHNLKNDEDPLDLKYRLYAVVSHSGMLNGGHYVSYASNPNGSWYCYNDSSCREIHTRPNIDPSSAYLLFYERVGLDYEPYLPNVDGQTLPNGNAIDADDSDNDLRKMCVLS